MQKITLLCVSLFLFSGQMRAQTVTVLYPNGGETFSQGSTVGIQWTWTGTTTTARIQLWNNGVLSDLNASATCNNGTNSWSWTIPGSQPYGTNYKIYITTGTSSDYSNSTFTIGSTGTVTVSYPNGGETFSQGSTVGIQWTWTGTTTTARIQLWNNGVLSDLNASATCNNGTNSWSWTIPGSQPYGTNYKIYITTGTSSDYSNSTFTIGSTGTVTVSYPNGGENWSVGSSKIISWASSNVASLRIEYTTNAGSNWLLISSSVTASGGSYSWSVPNTPSNQCKVRLSDAANPAVTDVSDGTFSISDRVANLTVSLTSVDFGTLVIGHTYTIPIIFTNLATSNDDLSIAAGFLSSPFSHNATASYIIHPGQSKSIDVTFGPTSQGTFSESWTVNHTATNQSTPLNIQLHGIGQIRTVSMTVVPSQISFPGVLVGQSSTQAAVFTNQPSSNDVLVVEVGALSAPFLHNALSSYTLVPGESRTVNVTFSPGSAGAFSQNWSVHHTATNEPDPKVIMVEGTGISEGVGMIVSSQSINFGTCATGDMVTEPITFTNQASSNAYLSVLPGTVASPFRHDATASLNIPPGQSRTVNVSFMPTSTGSFTENWSVSHNAANIQNPVVISLAGIGTTGQPNIYQVGSMYVRGDSYENIGGDILATGNPMIGAVIEGNLRWVVKFNSGAYLRFNPTAGRIYFDGENFDSFKFSSVVYPNLFIEYREGDLPQVSVDALSASLTINGKGFIMDGTEQLDWFRGTTTYSVVTRRASADNSLVFGNPLLGEFVSMTNAIFDLDNLTFHFSAGLQGQEFTLNEWYKVRTGTNGLSILLNFNRAQNGGDLTLVLSGGVGNIFEVNSGPNVGSISYDFLPATTSFGVEFHISALNGSLEWTRVELTDAFDLSISGELAGIGISVDAGSFFQLGGGDILMFHADGRYSLSLAEASLNIGHIVIDGTLGENGFEFDAYQELGIGDLFTYASSSNRFQVSIHPKQLSATGTLFFNAPPGLPPGVFPTTLFGGLHVNLENQTVYLTTDGTVSLYGWTTFGLGDGWLFWDNGTKNDIGMFVSGPLGSIARLQMTSLNDLSIPLNSGILKAGIHLGCLQFDAGSSYEMRPEGLTLRSGLLTIVLTNPLRNVLDDSVNYCLLNSLFPQGLAFSTKNTRLILNDSFGDAICLGDNYTYNECSSCQSIYGWVESHPGHMPLKTIYDHEFYNRMLENSEYDFIVQNDNTSDSVNVRFMIPRNGSGDESSFSYTRSANASSVFRFRIRKSDVMCFVDLDANGTPEDSTALVPDDVIPLSQLGGYLYIRKPLKITSEGRMSWLLNWETSRPTGYVVVGGLTDSTLTDTLAADRSLDSVHLIYLPKNPNRYKYIKVVATSSDTQAVVQGPVSMNIIQEASVEPVYPIANSVNVPTSLTFKWTKGSDDPMLAERNSLHSYRVNGPGNSVATVGRYWFELVRDTVSHAGELSDSTLADTIKTVFALSDSTRYYWHLRGQNELGWGPFSDWASFTTGAASSETVKVFAGWNIVSVPTLSADMTANELFPNAATLAFGFSNDSGYIPTRVLETGKGYFLRFTNAYSFLFSGARVLPPLISVTFGWNLVGALDWNVPVYRVTSSPPEIIATQFFGCAQNGYYVADTLKTGEGYFVRMTNTGTLSLNESLARTIAHGTTANSLPEQSWIRLTLTDSERKASSLYLASQEQLKGNFELPPRPPEGILDFRFSSNNYVESCSGAHEILLHSAAFPITLMAENLSTGTLQVSYDASGKVVSRQLYEGALVRIEIPVDRLRLTMASDVPTSFALSQNFPNPFNPVTTIRYQLPTPSKVRLALYNLLGQEVATLVNEEKDAGYYEQTLDARNLSSGVYFYRLLVGGFIETRKMIILK
jgi:hypothetical protein